MKVDIMQILAIADRLVIVPAAGGYAVSACCGVHCVLLHDGVSILVYPSFVDAAEAFKHSLRSGVPILLDMDFDIDAIQ